MIFNNVFFRELFHEEKSRRQVLAEISSSSFFKISTEKCSVVHISGESREKEKQAQLNFLEEVDNFEAAIIS